MTEPAGEHAVHWSAGPFAAFDTESTGVDTATARIVTATVVHIKGATSRALSWLAAVDDIPVEATAVHGITSDHARVHGRPPRMVLAEVVDALAAAWRAGPVVIYNARFDLTLLWCDTARHGLTMCPIGPVIDPLVLDKAFDTYRPGSRRLADVAAHYGIVLDDAHDATADALAAARVAWKLARLHSQIRDLTLDDLQVWQGKWYAEQQHGFAKYLRTKIVEKVRADAGGLVGDELQAKLDEITAIQARADQVDADAEAGWPIAGAGA